MKNVTQLCEDLELAPNLEKSDRGFYLLPLNEGLRISIGALNPGVFLYSPLSQCPKRKKEELLIKLMQANLFGQGTLGAVIGYDAQENLLTLSADFSYDMDYGAFKENVENFANIVEYWREEISLHEKKAREEIL